MAIKMKPKIILISGKIQSGKNTVGAFIEEEAYKESSVVVASFYFAQALKDMTAEISNRIFKCKPINFLDLESESIKSKVIPYKFNAYGCTYRKFLQIFGTQFMRKLFSDNIWVDIVIEKIESAIKYGMNIALVTDTRFPNEISRIKEVLGGKCDVITLRVERPKAKFKIKSFKDLVTAIKTVFKFKKEHISETALDKYNFDYVIVNDGTKKELKEKVKKFLDELK